MSKRGSADSPGPSGNAAKKTKLSNDAEEEVEVVYKERALIIPRQAHIHEPDEAAYRGVVVSDAATHLFTRDKDYSYLALKPDSQSRPIWVCADGRIILEAFSPHALQAQDFLITIAEPLSRPSRMHEFKISSYSLYAAVSVGMEPETILQVLERFSKVTVPEAVVQFIKDQTVSCGKVKMVLKDTRYFLQSSYPETLRHLLQDQLIADARIKREDEPDPMLPGKQPGKSSKPSTPASSGGGRDTPSVKDEFGAVITLDRDDEQDDTLEDEDLTYSFEISKEKVEDVKKRCNDLEYPLMEEYDFRRDGSNSNLDIDLQPKTTIRDYQEKCLSKMFGGGEGRARSGVIVLPTGAGKTLVGITAACTIKKSTLVLCTNSLSVEQWAKEFKNWATVKEGQVAKFTAENKNRFAGDSGILISTYTMISTSGKRAKDTAEMLKWISSFEWGLLILDEVHVVPANVFRRVITTVAAHTKLGLTATLVREDDKINDLNFLIGPKLYEANWMDLAARGHIAKVEAAEIWCPMTPSFFDEYRKPMTKAGTRRLLCVLNPYKIMVCQHLIQEREAAGDKILVFSDNVFALDLYAKLLKKPFIYGQTSHEERTKYLHLFRTGVHATLFLSKVGDTSLDLPEATCLIQISSQFGSRRQEAQRLGRILRAKRRNEEGFKCRFYTLVSRDTDEVQFSAKRRSFLVDQGYEFKIISSIDQLIPVSKRSQLHYSDPVKQRELLETIQAADEAAGAEEVIADTLGPGKSGGAGRGRGANGKKKDDKNIVKTAGMRLMDKWRKGM
ncbi:hypothetical protein HK104_001713 [Borealophlyctis nickersoniae]|nr:hypothetical protein HK104_001713 [Borealophlyctis nickersoniae]